MSPLHAVHYLVLCASLGLGQLEQVPVPVLTSWCNDVNVHRYTELCRLEIISEIPAPPLIPHIQLNVDACYTHWCCVIND